MKKIVNIMVAILLVTIIIPITSAAAKEEVNGNDGTKWNIATQCDCENLYSSHNKNLSNKLNKKGIDSKIVACNCGSKIFARVAHTGEWNYSKAIACKHGRQGMDYIYTRKILTAYDCNRCDYYGEVDSTESKTVCKGA